MLNRTSEYPSQPLNQGKFKYVKYSLYASHILCIIYGCVDKDGNEVPKGEHKFMQMSKGPKDTYECDYDGMEIVHKRMKNGFRLFGKYYEGLWD